MKNTNCNCDIQTQYECGGLGANQESFCTFCNCYCPCKTITIPWFSRHNLTNGQIATLKSYYGENITVEKHDLIFTDQIITQIQEITDNKVISVVAPLHYGLILLRAGYTLIDFINIPSARQNGVFICKGMNIHTLNETISISCPLSIEEQEESSLSPTLR